MNFTILLQKSNTNQNNSQNWVLIDKSTIQYTYSNSHLLISSGSEIKEDNIEPEKIRRDANSIYKFIVNLNKGYLKKDKVTSISLRCQNKKTNKQDVVIRDFFLEGLTLSNYDFSKYKKSKSLKMFNLKTNFSSSILNYSIQGNYIARDLVNAPLSHLTAVKLSSIIKKLGKEAGFKVKVLNEKDIYKLKMGGVLSVNKGSVAKPTFNILTYKPKNSINKAPYVLVGKGVMYDTGGLSLKPTSNSMDMMKCDMAGAASVVGTMYSLAKAKSNCYVIALVPAVENRPGGEAYVPGDVIKMMSGSTVEVLNTDAEGRLIMADALHYAKKYKPKCVIDVATLTGAAARAIGKYGVVAMEKDAYYPSKFMYSLWKSGYYTGERIAIQPFWDDYNSQLDSAIADLKNLGGPEAGHITAGKFLEHFVDYPWIHLDIAGSAFLTNEYLYYKHGATGVGVRLLSHFLHNINSQ